MKFLLFHAIRPDFAARGNHDWDSFLCEASQVQLPPGAERLAPNVWLLPDGCQTEGELGRRGERWSIESTDSRICWRVRLAASLDRFVSTPPPHHGQ